MTDTDLTSVPITVMPAHSPALGSLDPLTQMASDIDVRFAAGKAARLAQVAALDVRTSALEAKPDLTSRVGVLETRPIVPDLTIRVTALEAKPAVPDLTARVTTLEARPNYTTATLTTAGVIKANVTQVARTTTPISVNVAMISAVAASILPSVSVTVTGVALGDFVQASFAAAPPSGLTISAAQATAANTVLVTFVATGALTLAAGAQSLNFCWTR